MTVFSGPAPLTRAASRGTGSGRLGPRGLGGVVLGCAALLLPLLAPPARANMMQQIITGKCSQAMQDEFQKAGKTPPAGMVAFTCSCVADGMLKRRQGLEQAKAACVQQATQKFGPS